MRNWYKSINSQMSEEQPPKFKVGDEVVIDQPNLGMFSGIISSTYNNVDGEWQYKVMVDDVATTMIVNEYNMELES